MNISTTELQNERLMQYSSLNPTGNHVDTSIIDSSSCQRTDLDVPACNTNYVGYECLLSDEKSTSVVCLEIGDNEQDKSIEVINNQALTERYTLPSESKSKGINIPLENLSADEDNKEMRRKSLRDPNVAMLNRSDVKQLLEKIRSNHDDTVVLKIKEHLLADITACVLDEIIESLKCNKVCQALYLQNLTRAMHDEQLVSLTSLLKRKKIWCVNLGENYSVSAKGWIDFCRDLRDTFVTHLVILNLTDSEYTYLFPCTQYGEAGELDY
jgi:hypothetical protein